MFRTSCNCHISPRITVIMFTEWRTTDNRSKINAIRKFPLKNELDMTKLSARWVPFENLSTAQQAKHITGKLDIVCGRYSRFPWRFPRDECLVHHWARDKAAGHVVETHLLQRRPKVVSHAGKTIGWRKHGVYWWSSKWPQHQRRVLC